MQRDTGASVRIYNIAKGLVENGHNVTVVIPRFSSSNEIVDGIKVYSSRGLLPRALLNVLKRFVNVDRSTALYFYDFLFISRIMPLLIDSDVVQIEQQSAGGLLIPLIKRVLKKPVVVDCHDVFQASRVKHTSVFRKILELFLEKLAYNTADLLLTVSKIEKDLLISMGFKNRKITIIPNGVDIKSFVKSSNHEELQKRYKTEGYKLVVFVGNLDYYPNREAVEVLSSIIAPTVLNKIKNVKFFIVGKTSKELKSPTLFFTGFVENISDVLSISDVAVAPLFHGSGTRLKILEYLSCGLPVVSTSLGAEGLDVQDSVNILIEDNIESFGSRIIDVLSNPRLSEALGTAARMVVVTRYNWANITKELGQVFAANFSAKD
jgi:glycosyltransferase involved in cell wall biosynthesis